MGKPPTEEDLKELRLYLDLSNRYTDMLIDFLNGLPDEPDAPRAKIRALVRVLAAAITSNPDATPDYINDSLHGINLLLRSDVTVCMRTSELIDNPVGNA